MVTRTVRLGATVAAVLTLIGTVIALVPSAAGAAAVDPERISGNVSHCPTDELAKFDPVRSGTFAVAGGTITVSVSGKSFSWSSTGLTIFDLYVKGGPDTNLYSYPGGATSDTGLRSPTHRVNGGQPGLSHINFCGTPGDPVDPPSIDIEKFVNGDDADNPPGPALPVGSTATFTYEVTNTGPVHLYRIMVTDNVAGMLTCPRGNLAPGASMSCTSTTMTVDAGQQFMEACVKGFNSGIRVDDCDPVFYTGTTPS